MTETPGVRILGRVALALERLGGEERHQLRGGWLLAGTLVGHTQAKAADPLRTIGMERERAHDLVGRAAVSASRGR